MNIVTRKRDESLRFLRPNALGLALSTLAFAGTLLIGKPALAEEPITVARGPAAAEMRGPKNEVEYKGVSFKTEGVVGQILTIKDETGKAVIEVRDKHDKVVDTVRVGKHVAFIVSEPGELEVSVNGQTVGSVWVRSTANGEESALDAIDAACGMILQGIETGQTREQSLSEALAEITAGKSMKKTRESGREDQLTIIQKMYENGASAEQILMKMSEWSYLDFTSTAGAFNALVRMANDRYSCKL